MGEAEKTHREKPSGAARSRASAAQTGENSVGLFDIAFWSAHAQWRSIRNWSLTADLSEEIF
ncbi:MAG: hypothetical protein ACRBBV_06365 [Paracoccaceae bacterium]